MVKSRFKNALLVATASAALLSAGAANASVLLDFEAFDSNGLKNQEEILNFYNGGTGSMGSGPGPSDGVTFSANALASISLTDGGGTGNFKNAPSKPTANFFTAGTGLTLAAEVMNSTGFTNSLSFFYSSNSIAVGGVSPSVTVYSGPNGTGSVLASLLDLADTMNNGTSCSSSNPPPSNCGLFNNWVSESVSFSGTAESVVFAGSVNRIGFDNITLGAVPAPIMGHGLPSGLAVAGILFGAKLLQRSRRRRSLGVGIPRNAV
jgi:hypothetical protein